MGELHVAGMGLERAAAALAPHHHHLEAVVRQHPGRGDVRRAEELGHHAAGEEAHAPALLTARRHDGGKRAALAPGWHARRQRTQAGRQQRQHHAGRGAALAERHQVEEGAQPAPLRNNVAQSEALQPARRSVAESGLLHPRACLLQQRPVAHARRARRIARAAAEAQERLLHDHVAQRDLPLRQAPHQVDAAARGRGLAACLEVGGAGGQAQPAVHAVERVGIQCVGHQMPPRSGRG